MRIISAATLGLLTVSVLVLAPVTAQSQERSPVLFVPGYSGDDHTGFLSDDEVPVGVREALAGTGG